MRCAASHIWSTVASSKEHASHTDSCSHNSTICHISATSSKPMAMAGEDTSTTAWRPYIQSRTARKRSWSISGKFTSEALCSRNPLVNIFKKYGDLAESTSRCTSWREPSAEISVKSQGNTSAASVILVANTDCASASGVNLHERAAGEVCPLSPLLRFAPEGSALSSWETLRFAFGGMKPMPSRGSRSLAPRADAKPRWRLMSGATTRDASSENSS
mmetsp:Transcript_105526/g.303471  ORF Transcript_105526/g.303471 Transcript_105526/m.303471 type:complete len:217 (-) Transcript_105526:7-657(-)